MQEHGIAQAALLLSCRARNILAMYNDGLQSPGGSSHSDQAVAASPPFVLYWIAFGPFAMIVAFAGFWSAFSPIQFWQRVVCFTVGVVALAPFAWKSRELVRKSIKYYRIMRDRCMNCGYPLDGVPSAICPECGKDPVEWSETHSARNRSTK